MRMHKGCIPAPVPPLPLASRGARGFRAGRSGSHLAVGETVCLLHPPLHLTGVETGIRAGVSKMTVSTAASSCRSASATCRVSPVAAGRRRRPSGRQRSVRPASPASPTSCEPPPRPLSNGTSRPNLDQKCQPTKRAGTSLCTCLCTCLYTQDRQVHFQSLDEKLTCLSIIFSRSRRSASPLSPAHAQACRGRAHSAMCIMPSILVPRRASLRKPPLRKAQTRVPPIGAPTGGFSMRWEWLQGVCRQSHKETDLRSPSLWNRAAASCWRDLPARPGGTRHGAQTRAETKSAHSRFARREELIGAPIGAGEIGGGEGFGRCRWKTRSGCWPISSVGSGRR